MGCGLYRGRHCPAGLDGSQPQKLQTSGKTATVFCRRPGCHRPTGQRLHTGTEKRSKDSYSSGDKLTRPERTTIVYTNALHRQYPQIPIIIGGIEASLRRFAHYDYWSNSIRQGILADAPASLLVYGMGELALIQIAKRMQQGDAVDTIRDIPDTCWTMSVENFAKTRRKPP